MVITVCGGGAAVTQVPEGRLVPGGDGGTRNNAAKEAGTGGTAGGCQCIRNDPIYKVGRFD